jgi:glucose/arabinose dehydrogenase
MGKPRSHLAEIIALGIAVACLFAMSLAYAGAHTGGSVDAVTGASAPATTSKPASFSFRSAGQEFELHEIARTGEVIWAMDFIDANTMVFTERTGRLKLLNLTSLEITSLAGAPEILRTDSGGLFDVLVDPEFAKNRLLYFTYVKPEDGGSAIALARAELSEGRLQQLRDLFVANNPSDDHAHWGSRVVMDEQRYLFMTSGDRHVPNNAQSLRSHGGKVLRFNADGSIPPENPFSDEPNAAPEIWTLGHRNPQGLTIHPQTGELFEQEHGPTGGDEINIIVESKNYGWPLITYGDNIWGGQEAEGTEREGLEQPLIYFKPGIAPTGLDFYFGDALPGWNGSLLSATLRGYLVRLELRRDGSAWKVVGEERLLQDWRERMRDVVTGPDGMVYIATESGAIARLQPAAGE